MNNSSDNLLHVGDPLPNLTLTALDGDQIDFQNFRGKNFIIFMWASW